MSNALTARYQQRLNEKNTHPGTEHDAVDVQQHRHGTSLGEGSAKIEGRRETREHRGDHGAGHGDEEEPQPQGGSLQSDRIHVRLLNPVTVLLLDVAMQIVEARVQGLTIGRERPARNFDHLAVVQIRFLDGPLVD